MNRKNNLTQERKKYARVLEGRKDEDLFFISQTTVSKPHVGYVSILMGYEGLLHYEITSGKRYNAVLFVQFLNKLKALPSEAVLVLDQAPWTTSKLAVGAIDELHAKVIFMPRCSTQLCPIKVVVETIYRRMMKLDSELTKEEYFHFLLITTEL